MKLIYIILMMGSIFTTLAAPDKAQHQMQRFTETVTITKPTDIKIINPYGDIRIRKADDDQFIYHGVAQSQISQQVQFDFQQNGSQITATVKYSVPDKTNHQDRFDLALIVPPMVSLDIEIEGGSLSTKGLESALKVRTNEANIQIKTSKAVDLFSKNGNIELTSKVSASKSQSKVQTHQGQVTVLYHNDMPRFEINTGKYVTSNSESLLKSHSQQDRTHLYGNKKSSHQITIKTDTGQVSLIDLSE